MRSIEELKKNLAINAFGQSKEEAQQSRVCINCGQPIFWGPKEPSHPGLIYSKAGLKEYQISGVCEHCFDNLTLGPITMCR